MNQQETTKSLLAKAILHEQEGETDKAIDLYGSILMAGDRQELKQIINAPIGDTPLHQAYQGLSRLAASKDEVTWETASQVLGDIRAMFG